MRCKFEGVIDDKKDDDDIDDDDHTDHSLIRTRVTCSSEIRTEKMQALIPTPPKPPRTDLSSDKAITQEMMVSVSPTPTTSSQDQTKPTSDRYSHILGIKDKVDATLKNIIPKLAITATNDMMNDNLPRIIANAVRKERESLTSVVPALISQEFVAHAQKIIEEIFKIHMQNRFLNMKSDLQSQVADPELWDVLRAKFKKSSASAGSCRVDAFPNAIVMTIRETILLLRGEKNTEEKKYVLSLHKIHAISFPEEDLEEKMNQRRRNHLDYNNSFVGEYECSSLALDREERRDEKEEIGSLETRSNNVSDQEIYAVFIARNLQRSAGGGLGGLFKKEKSLDYNNSFLGEYECSSLALDKEERIDEKKRLDHLKLDQTMLVIKRFRIPNGQLVAVVAVPDISGGRLAT
ncbi:hypothetical protein Tco_0450421 [Tanacetum coccineum]